MKRVLVGLAVAASLLVAASPVAAADTNHYRASGSGASAFWTNWPTDVGVPTAGEYFQTTVIAADQIEGPVSVQDTTANGLCIDYSTYTIDEQGNYTGGESLYACDTAAQLTFDKRLGSDHLVGSVPVTECTAWDEMGDCIGEWVTLGTFAVDLNLTGTGRIARSHYSDSGGTAGMWQFTMHGTSQERTASVTGTVTFNGASIIADATSQGGRLWTSKSGSVDITICNPKNGC